jgi:hypothetical protein
LFVFGHTENAPASVQAGQDGVEHLWGYAQALMTRQELEIFNEVSICIGERFSRIRRASIR